MQLKCRESRTRAARPAPFEVAANTTSTSTRRAGRKRGNQWAWNSLPFSLCPVPWLGDVAHRHDVTCVRGWVWRKRVCVNWKRAGPVLYIVQYHWSRSSVTVCLCDTIQTSYLLTYFRRRVHPSFNYRELNELGAICWCRWTPQNNPLRSGNKTKLRIIYL